MHQLLHQSISTPERSAGRVLVLDDDGVGRAVAAIAESVGMACVHASDCAQFLETFEQWSPTHIVLDLMMPETDGVEVIAQLAARNCSAEVIVMSGAADRVLEAARRAASANELDVVGVLPKPFTSRMLTGLLMRSGDAVSGLRSRRVEAAKRLPITAAEVARALRRGEFQLVYQPKVRCTDRSLTGFEALLRWRHPVHGRILAHRFIGAAEPTRQVPLLTEFVLEQGVAWLSRHPRTDVSLAVNVSAACLEDEDFADRLIRLCARHEVDPARIVLELTETAATDGKIDVLVLLTRLRLKGVRLSIDDFGTGYSSMAQLARLPFTEIKIDKSFVMSAASSEASRSIIEATINLGRRLDLRVVAEGVEDEGTLEYLRRAGCEFVQGHLIARPMSAAAAIAWPAEAEAGEAGAEAGAGHDFLTFGEAGTRRDVLVLEGPGAVEEPGAGAVGPSVRCRCRCRT